MDAIINNITVYQLAYTGVAITAYIICLAIVLIKEYKYQKSVRK